MPVADVDAHDGKIIVRTQFHERHLVQQVPGSRYNSSAGHWTVPLSWSSCVTLRGVFGDSLIGTNEFAEWSWALYQERIMRALSLRDALTLPPDDPVALAIDAVEAM